MRFSEKIANYIIRRVARAKGFLDPIAAFAQIQKFAQPSEVTAPVELLRLAAVLHTRGLMNAQVIQQNLDWILPYWIVRQFNPQDISFVPRAFSLTHINLTHRNWTAVGIPDFEEMPIVDPRGLVSPFYDSWSLDCWVLPDKGEALIPSKLSAVEQTLCVNGNLKVITRSTNPIGSLITEADVYRDGELGGCRLGATAVSSQDGWLVISLRPFNPEGICLVHHIRMLEDRAGWIVNNKRHVLFHDAPEQIHFSTYHEGDVFFKLRGLASDRTEADCNVGMASAAAMYRLKAGEARRAVVHVSLDTRQKKFMMAKPMALDALWQHELEGSCRAELPDERWQFLYDSAIRSMVLLSPGENVYPGPYTYKRFWFRDAAIILETMATLGLLNRAEKVLDTFPKRQTPFGYFHSQEGEWDSNGQALWVMERFTACTNRMKPEWAASIDKGAQWIRNKRNSHSNSNNIPTAGLMPAGFSAEHLGPNDFYYWDDFWSVAGLHAASRYFFRHGEKKKAAMWRLEAIRMRKAIETSLVHARSHLGRAAMPASPFRRLDTGAIGSICAGYPLQLFEARDERLLDTVEYLLQECFVAGGFFHDMAHSGINPYLTLQIAQVLLRAQDPRYEDVMNGIAALATPTGQWPEAVHPATRGGCMGDGQHLWAAAEWAMMIRNCFVREEGRALILCSGIPKKWLSQNKKIFFGKTQTRFGYISVTLEPDEHEINISWECKWHGGGSDVPQVKVRLFPGQESVARLGETRISIPKRFENANKVDGG